MEVRLHSLTVTNIRVDNLMARPYLSTEKSFRYIMERKFGGPFRTFGGKVLAPAGN